MAQPIHIQHTPECVAHKELLEALDRQYLLRYPNYCKVCMGWGGVEYTENQAPLGSGRHWPETGFDLCEECWGKGICPRCGKRAWVEDDDVMDTPCPHCGWGLSEHGGCEGRRPWDMSMCACIFGNVGD